VAGTVAGTAKVLKFSHIRRIGTGSDETFTRVHKLLQTAANADNADNAETDGQRMTERAL
jgi:signal recognition particle GTPase